ncbi:MAG: FAD-dependent oxidoreductase [Clostridiales bacterium]|nr:FAD-dependent oxidoreductase [Clostridiales bacterium]
MNEYDLIIIGGGVAGCSAAITARQRNLTTLVLYAGDGALGKTKLIDNYPGFPHVAGPDLLQHLRNHASSMGAELTRALVRRVMPLGDNFSVLAGNDLFMGKSVILAMGTARVRMLEGEEELVGQGVSYCATCDGMFYRGGTVLVIASDHEAIEEAMYLSTLAKVLYVKERPHDTSELPEAITQLPGNPLSLKAVGEQIVLTTNEGEVSADGVFVLRPAVAMTQLIPEVEVQGNKLVLDSDLMTSIPGVYAAGDIAGAPLQAAKAAGEGNIAVLAAARYLTKKSATSIGVSS